MSNPAENSLPSLMSIVTAGGAVDEAIVDQANAPASPVPDTADQVVNGDAARSAYDVDGTGIKIGIISDSFNLSGGAAADESDGALPAAGAVHIVADGTSGHDEGRAMAQIVHTIAPGAQIYFYTCGTSDAAMAQAITALQQQGCQIIVDDVTFFDEPFYEQGGTIAQAVDQVVAQGSTYFTAAGNAATSFYEGIFNPIAVVGRTGKTVEAQDFAVAGSLEPWLEPITIPIGDSVTIDLQWDQPFRTALGAAKGPGAANSMGYELFNAQGKQVAQGTANETGANPVQVGTYTNSTGSTSLYLEVFQNGASGLRPGQFKIVIDDNAFTPVTFDDPNAGIGSGTVIGHEADPNAITVGAAPENDPATMEPFSSVGPGEALFDASGARLGAPVSDGKVDLVAPDGNGTTVSGLDPFDGTSAAAPAAAAVGALVLQENPALDPNDIANILADTATPIAASSALAGAGLVNALPAVGDAQTLTFTASAATATLLGTHLDDTFIGGPGNHTIDGEGGIDTLDYSGAAGAVIVNFATGAAANGDGGTDLIANIEIAKGSAFADAFIAGAAGETLFGGGGLDNVDFSVLGGGGVLALDGGTFAADRGSNSGSNAGTILVAAGSALQIVGLLENDGALVANGGGLDVTGAIIGAGSALVENGAVFEIGGSDNAGVTFGGDAATLKLDLPGSFAGPIGGLAPGDTIDFVSMAVSSGRIDGSILTVTESGGATLIYTVAGALAGNGFTVADDGAGGTDLVLANTGDRLAEATIDGPSSITLGSARVGSTLSAALGITNSAAPPADALDVTVGGTTGDATAAGAIDRLGAGETDAADIVVGLGTASAGAQSGAVTLGFLSDGAGTTSLPSQTVQLSGKIYRDAAPVIGGLPQTFIVHVGDTVAAPLAIANSAAADGYSENLRATVAATGGAITAQGSTGAIAAQATSDGIAIGFSTASAGSVAGSVTLDLQSDGSGIDGLGTVALGPQTVAVNATVDNFATAVLHENSGGGTWSGSGNSYALDLGTLARGAAPAVVDLGVANGAVGPADLLSGSFTTASAGGFTIAGLDPFAGLGAGQADNEPSVTLDTSTGGSFSATITLSATSSNASGYAGALGDQTLTITGTIAPTLAWAGPTTRDRSGNWNNAAGWSPAVLPAAATTAIINKAGSYTVTSSESNSVGALTLGDATATLAISGGTFSILGTSSNAGTIAVGDGATLQLGATMTNSGTIAVTSAGDATALAIAGGAILKGAGRIVLSGAAIVSAGAAATLTNQSTISGAGTIGDSFLAVTNAAAGVIDASGGASGLTLAGRGVTNLGLVEATAGASLTIANTTISGTGGTIAAAGGNVYLDGATVTANTLQSSAGGVIATAGATSTLSGITLAGTVAVTDGTTLAVKGTITNNGKVALNAAGRLVIAANTTVKGSGGIALGDAAANLIAGNGTAATLTNQAVIAGAGTIGDASLTLVNAAGGTIDATGAANALAITTGSHTVANSGLIEATASGGLTIAGALANSGTLAASGGALAVAGAVTGAGQATIAGSTLAFAKSVAATQAVTFAPGTTGMLQLGVAQSFAGTVAGLAAGDAIDLVNFRFAGSPTIAGVAALVQNGSPVGAAVTVQGGALSATISLMNQFGVQYSTSPGAYTLASDATGAHPGTLLALAPAIG